MKFKSNFDTWELIDGYCGFIFINAKINAQPRKTSKPLNYRLTFNWMEMPTNVQLHLPIRIPPKT